MDKIKDVKTLEDIRHRAKMTKWTENSIQFKNADNSNYIQINDNKLTDAINRQINEMLSLNGEIDTSKIINREIVDLNLLSMYDKNNEIVNYDIKEVDKGAEYWEKETDKYIQYLENLAKQDISNLDRKQFNKLVVKNNEQMIKKYMLGINANAIDLADVGTRYVYAKRMTDSVVELQTREIQKIGYDKFLKTDLDTLTNFTFLVSKKHLKAMQNNVIDVLDKLHLKDDLGEVNNNKITISLFRQYIEQIELPKQLEATDKLYNNDKEFYDKRHSKREQIADLLKIIGTKYKEHQDYLDTPRYRAMDTDTAILEEMHTQSKDIDKAKLNTSLLSNKLFTGKIIDSGEQYAITFLEKNTNADITTNITIYDANNKEIILNKKHRDINDAVGSLLDAGIRYLTLKQLYNFINKGILTDEPVDKDKLDELLKELNKMDKKADIDATQQFNLRGYQEALQEYEKKTGKRAKPIISQNLINFKLYKNFPLKNGETTTIICFMDYPAVYDYARQYRQLAPYPAEILNIGYSPKNNIKNNTIQINEITKTIRNELIREIELRKNPTNINQPIVINNFLCNKCQFYDVIDANIVDKNNIHTKVLNKQKRIRYTNHIETILNNFIDKGYIKGYTINKKGRADKYSITIHF